MDETSLNGVPDPSDDENTEHSNGLRAFADLGEFLAKDGWYPRKIDDTYAYRMTYNGDSAEFRCTALIRVELEQFAFYATSTVKVPEQVRVAAAEYLMRANYGLRIGNFELDFSDGEVRYKSSLDFEGDQLTPQLIKNAIYPPVRNMDDYFPGLMKVIFGQMSPVEAIAEIES